MLHGRVLQHDVHLMNTLTPVQFELARHWAAGLHYREAAVRAGVNVNGAHVLLRRLRERLGAATRRDMAVVLADCTVRPWDGGGQASRRGLVRGEPVRLTGGRFAGRDGVYVGANNSDQVYVRIGGGVFAVMAKYVAKDAA